MVDSLNLIYYAIKGYRYIYKRERTRDASAPLIPQLLLSFLINTLVLQLPDLEMSV